ncbi:hypothetical protein BQ8482_111268 [Mesorhizobium delmotii]|uniref:Uncharacterized protein n=1 Tax=Mesorhizobium delmotii TaxID=1631247 RepID=A0A2P9ADX4_9HYPH|nr:hypothetical protein BQ8482_111268 [Mesorhizobium delmotii]
MLPVGPFPGRLIPLLVKVHAIAVPVQKPEFIQLNQLTCRFAVLKRKAIAYTFCLSFSQFDI